MKNRKISLQKMSERHKKEIQESESDLGRHEDDRIRIEEHFSKEIENLEAKQSAEFKFNSERLLSDSARGHLKKVDLFELEEGQVGSNGHGDDWDVNEQHESFTVNLGNQLKITQNIRLVRCNIQGRVYFASKILLYIMVSGFSELGTLPLILLRPYEREISPL